MRPAVRREPSYVGAGGATVTSYTGTTPTAGTTVGTADSYFNYVGLNGASLQAPIVTQFGQYGLQSVVLRGTGQCLSINLTTIGSAAGLTWMVKIYDTRE